jgi:biopolymer transport protein ExbD
MMRVHVEENLNGNLTAMIDVVFQLIIFFVATTSLQSQAIEDRVKLAMAPHGKEVKAKVANEVVISVRSDGAMAFGNGPRFDRPTLTAILKKIRADSGGTPSVVIRADGSVIHEYVKNAMDACTDSGVWKIKFQALKEQGKKG